MTINLNCPYCEKIADFVDGRTIYPHRKDLWDLKFLACMPCGAYVGCHKNSGKPLGRLAKANLRKLKSMAHAAFDPIWKENLMGRTDAYKWLSGKLHIKYEECHIGMFDETTCENVVTLSCIKYKQLVGAKNETI